MEITLIILIIWIVISVFKETSKENIKSSTDYINDNNVVMDCPNCSAPLEIHGEGSGDCTFCNTNLTYYNNLLYKEDEVQAIWVIYIMEVLAKFSKLDGKVSENELNIVDENISFFLEPTKKQKNNYRSFFNKAKNFSENYEEILIKINNLMKEVPEAHNTVRLFLLESMLEIGLSESGDKDINHKQRDAINNVVRIFNVDYTVYENLTNKYKKKYWNNLDHFYKVLECEKHATDKEIKSQYRKLSKKFHPDTYSSKDLPQELIDMAVNRFKEINEAYEEINKRRKAS